MANFGLSHPIMAKLNVATGVYSGVFKCGKAINTSVTPNYNEGETRADNGLDESIKEFKDATVELGVNTLPKKAAEILFGHKVEEDGTETSNANDSGSYVGYGFIVAEVNAGVKQYRACFLTKVKFKEGAESYQTKGDSIAFTTPTLSGAAFGNDVNDWRIKSPKFDTEQECDEWILEKMGLSDQLETLYAQAGMKLINKQENTNTDAEKTTTSKDTGTQTTSK